MATTQLELVALAVHRAREREFAERLQDPAVLRALGLIFEELSAIHAERDWVFDPLSGEETKG